MTLSCGDMMTSKELDALSDETGLPLVDLLDLSAAELDALSFATDDEYEGVDEWDGTPEPTDTVDGATWADLDQPTWADLYNERATEYDLPSVYGPFNPRAENGCDR